MTLKDLDQLEADLRELRAKVEAELEAEGEPAELRQVSVKTSPHPNEVQSILPREACKPTARPVSDSRPKFEAPAKRLTQWLRDSWSQYNYRRFCLEQRLQDALSEAQQERDESGARGLSRLFSLAGLRVLRAKIQLLRHGFRVPRPDKPPGQIRAELQQASERRLQELFQRLRKRNSGHRSNNGTSLASITPSPERNPMKRFFAPLLRAYGFDL